VTQSTSSAALQQTEHFVAHCSACAPWGVGWRPRQGEIHEARVLSEERAEEMRIILDRVCIARPNLPWRICLRPSETGETAQPGSYVLSFRFFERDRAEISNALRECFVALSARAPQTFEVLSGDYASGLGLPIRQSRPPQPQQASAASA
jgi:hypothetical protein